MIQIDYRDKRSLYEQVVDRFKELIANQVLKPDEKIPSVRNLAMELSITPNTIQRAYAELEKDGYIYTVKGRGNFVSSNEQLIMLHRKSMLDNLRDAALQAKRAGLSEEEARQIIHETYGGEL